MNRITPEELDARIGNDAAPHLLDVRERHEHAVATLPRSHLIPLRELPERHSEILAWQQEDIVVYCHHGWRSQQAVHLLAALGFEHLWNLEGGIDAWADRVDPRLPRY